MLAQTHTMPKSASVKRMLVTINVCKDVHRRKIFSKAANGKIDNFAVGGLDLTYVDGGYKWIEEPRPRRRKTQTKEGATRQTDFRQVAYTASGRARLKILWRNDDKDKTRGNLVKTNPTASGLTRRGHGVDCTKNTPSRQTMECENEWN